MGRIRFCQVGCGDCTFIHTSSSSYLIDCHDIHRHTNELPASRRFRGVFITHQHRDHYSGLQYLRDNGYGIDCLIYSSYERRHGDSSVTYEEWAEFQTLRDHYVERGTKVWTPFRQDSFDEPWWDEGEVKFRMIAPFTDLARSDTREIHDACLVVHVRAGERRFLVTGDASDSSLNRVSRTTTTYCGDVLRASHHGSINGADLDFVKGADSQYTVISTDCVTHDSVPHPTALQRYRDHTKHMVYRTDEFGCVLWSF